MNSTTAPANLPDDVLETRERFDEWRRTRVGQGRISEDLWDAAVKVAGKYGVHPTARMLQVDYKCLKRQVKEAAVSASFPKAEDGSVIFVEVHPAAATEGNPAEFAIDLDQLICDISEAEA